MPVKEQIQKPNTNLQAFFYDSPTKTLYPSRINGIKRPFLPLNQLSANGIPGLFNALRPYKFYQSNPLLAAAAEKKNVFFATKRALYPLR